MARAPASPRMTCAVGLLSRLMSVWYRPAVDADLWAVVALINASNRADGVAELLERSELAGEWSGDRTAMATDTWLAVDGDSCVGVAYTVHLPSETVHERCIIHGTVAPDRAQTAKPSGNRAMPTREATLTRVMKSCNNPPHRTRRTFTTARARMTATVSQICGQKASGCVANGRPDAY